MAARGVSAATVFAVCVVALAVASAAVSAFEAQRDFKAVKARDAQRTLVVLDSDAQRDAFATFLDGLEENGFKVTVATATDPSVSLTQFGAYLFDNIVVLAPAAQEFGGRISVDDLLNFVDDGGNVILATGPGFGESAASFAQECGILLDEDGTSVIDHFHAHESDSGAHTTIVADAFLKSASIWGASGTPAAVVYRGVGLALDEANPLLLPLLRAPATAYSHVPGTSVSDEIMLTGRDTVLLAALQARNNARVLISGSLDFFSDAAARQSVGGAQSGNAQAALQAAIWTFGGRGVLRARDVKHHVVGETETPSAYKVTDNVRYSIVIEQWNGATWEPYLGNDVFLEFSRIDPHVRTPLKHDGQGNFAVEFKVPDVVGVYQFKIHHYKVGYSWLEIADTIPVRPFRHNEYERFIPGAFPYYAGAFSMMAGFLVFSAVFLFSKPKSA